MSDNEEKIESTVVGAPSSVEARMKRAVTIGSGEREREVTKPLVPKRTLGDIEHEANHKIAALRLNLQAARRLVMDELTATLSSPTRKRNDAVEILRKDHDIKISKLNREEKEQIRSATDRIRNSYRDQRAAVSSSYEAAKVTLHKEHSDVLVEAEKKLIAGTEEAAKIFAEKRDEVLAWKVKAESEFRAAEKMSKARAEAVGGAGVI